MKDSNIEIDPKKTAFLVATFISSGKRLYIYNEKRNDPINYPLLFAVSLVSSTTSESKSGILIQSKEIPKNDLASILYHAYSALQMQPELKSAKKLFKKEKLALSPVLINLPEIEHTHPKYQSILEDVMKRTSKHHKEQQNSQL